LQLAKGLSGSKTDVFLQKLVLILASEDDPEGALEIWDNSYQNVRRAENVRASILAQLAKRDPRRALAKLERVGLENRGQSLCRLAVAQELLRHGDINAGLELMGKVGLTGAGYPLNGVLSASYDADVGIMTATSDPKLEAALWRAANERPAGRERSIVLTGLMKREAQRGGIEAVEQAFASVENFGDEERNATIGTILSPHASGGEVEKVEFVREHATGEYRSKTVNKIVSAWIHRDINAAGTWLGEQPPSPDHDQWIVEFTHSIHPIEPDAAAVWVDEIGDAELRARTAKLLGIKLQE
jgi:hypothetical protein